MGSNRFYVGKLKRKNCTWAALVITCQGKPLDGSEDRTVYLPLSQLKFTESYNHETLVHVPEWLIRKNNINWYRVSEIDPVE